MLEKHVRPRGSRLYITSHIDGTRISTAATEQELAARLAVALGEDVLVENDNPDDADRTLVRADGTLFRAMEVPQDDDAIVIHEAVQTL